jgi:hypothetical protein
VDYCCNPQCIWVWGSSDFLTPFSFMYNKPLENEMRHGPKILILFFIYIFFLIFQNYHSIFNKKILQHLLSCIKFYFIYKYREKKS